MTDEHGRFEAELQTIPGEKAFGVIRVKSPDYVPKAVQIAEAALRSEVTIVMRRAEGGARGAVLDSSGRPVRSYNLRVFCSPLKSSSPDGANLRSSSRFSSLRMNAV